MSGAPNLTAPLPRAITVEAACLALLARDAAVGGPITSWEARVARPPRWWPPGAGSLSAIGSPGTLVAAGCAAFLARRAPSARWVSVAAAVGTRSLLARLVARPRPPRDRWLEEPHGWSFPSRHTTYAMLLFCAVPGSREHQARTEALMVATGLIVGAARLRRGVHWPTDVVGAVLFTDLWWRWTVASHEPGRLACDVTSIRCHTVQ